MQATSLPLSFTLSARGLSAALLSAALLSACGGGGSDDDTTATDNNSSSASTPVPSATPAASSRTPAISASGVLVDTTSQRTLYTFSADAPNAGQSQCQGDCATKWPPMLATPQAQPSGSYGLITRPDGSRQWTYQGQPLYYWHFDQQAGDALGNGLGGQWSVARGSGAAEPTVLAPITHLGDLLVTSDSYRTLYTYDRDPVGTGQSQCLQACVATWAPVLAAASAQPYADLTLITRPDGSRQWAYQGQPLYTYASDQAPGDTEGDGATGHWAAAQIHLL